MKLKLLKLDNTVSDVEIKFEVKSSENLESDLALIARVKNQAQKQGTKLAKGRSEVRGHKAKPYKQKGTGRARQGSTAGPHQTGGGISHGPKQDYTSLSLNKKFKGVVLKRFLADYISNNQLSFIDLTGDNKAVRAFFSTDVKTLVIFSKDNVLTARSVSNLQKVSSLNMQNLSVFNVINYERILVDVNSKDELVNILNS